MIIVSHSNSYYSVFLRMNSFVSSSVHNLVVDTPISTISTLASEALVGRALEGRQHLLVVAADIGVV